MLKELYFHIQQVSVESVIRDSASGIRYTMMIGEKYLSSWILESSEYRDIKYANIQIINCKIWEQQ
jgi:hypothetical protein